MSVWNQIADRARERRRALLLAVFVGALVIRVVTTFVAGGNRPIPNDDQKGYHDYAEKIIAGNWLMEQNSYREVGYPLLLSLAYRTTDQRFLAGRLANALLGALTCVVVFVLAERLFGVPVAAMSAVWYSFFFHSVWLTLFIQREVTLALLVTVVVLLIVVARLRPWRIVVASLVYVALIHTDARFLFYLPFILLYFILADAKWGRKLQAAGVFAGVFVVAMVPWQVRNYEVYGEFVLVNTRTLSVQVPGVAQKRRSEKPRTKPGESHGEVRHLTPAQDALYDFTELYRVFRFRGEVRPRSDRFEEPWSLGHNLASILSYGVLLPFFVIGCWAIIRNRRREAYLLLLVILAHTSLHVIKWARVRYRIPIEPLIVIIAFYGLVWAIAWYRRRRAVTAHG